MEHLSIFLFFIFFLRDRGSKYIFKVLIFLQAAFSNKKAVHVSLNVCDYKKTKKEVMISSVAVEGILNVRCGEIRKGGKTAGPREPQSTVSLA